MALLDGLFDPRQYSGLLGDIQRWQRSPEQAQQAFDLPTSSYQFGGQMVPLYGQAPQQPEVSAQSRMPQAQPVQQPAQQPVSTADKMRSGFEGFVENAHTGPIGALLGGIMGYTGGGGNVTERALMAKGFDRDTARAAMRNPAFAPYLLGTKDETGDIKEYNFAVKQGFKGSFEEWMQKKKSVSGEYGLTPIWGTDAEGKPAFIQPGKAGTAIQGKLPEGFNISRDPLKVDAGTHYVLIDPQTRQTITTVPKNIAETEQKKIEGKGQGEASESLKSMQSKMPGLQKVITELDDLSNKATYTLGGLVIDHGMRQAGMEPREAAVARARYISMIDNQILPLLRDTFGSQFTQKEGETLRDTLGNPNLSPAEKQQVLKAFIEQKRRDIEALQSRFSPATPTQAAPVDPLGIRR